jgi:two-component system, OmpR family, response regulator ChvI
LEPEDDDYYLSNFDLTKEISFLDRCMKCCVCFVDMVNSTQVTLQISDRQKVRQYYSIFINTMAILARNYNAKIVKNAGDALIFYFPETSDSSNETAFKNMLECFTTMLSSRDIINAKLHSESLPSVSYRISADYGRVEIAKSTSSRTEDLFGSPMNICAKINSMAEPNGIVIGGDLYQMIESFSFIPAHEFKELEGGYSIAFDNKYPVYTVALSKDNNITSGKDINDINNPSFRFNKISKIKDVIAKQQLLQLQLQNNQQKEPQKYFTNVMIVDDEPDTLFTYEQFLSDDGYNIEAFTDPREALKHLVRLPNPSSYYKLVLLDIRMPKLNGLQLFNMIKSLSPHTKIMFCSALDIAEELVSILPDIKYDHLIKKPVEREYFISKINSMLNN